MFLSGAAEKSKIFPPPPVNIHHLIYKYTPFDCSLFIPDFVR